MASSISKEPQKTVITSHGVVVVVPASAKVDPGHVERLVSANPKNFSGGGGGIAASQAQQATSQSEIVKSVLQKQGYNVSQASTGTITAQRGSQTVTVSPWGNVVTAPSTAKVDTAFLDTMQPQSTRPVSEAEAARKFYSTGEYPLYGGAVSVRFSEPKTPEPNYTKARSQFTPGGAMHLSSYSSGLYTPQQSVSQRFTRSYPYQTVQYAVGAGSQWLGIAKQSVMGLGEEFKSAPLKTTLVTGGLIGASIIAPPVGVAAAVGISGYNIYQTSKESGIGSALLIESARQAPFIAAGAALSQVPKGWNYIRPKVGEYQLRFGIPYTTKGMKAEISIKDTYRTWRWNAPKAPANKMVILDYTQPMGWTGEYGEITYGRVISKAKLNTSALMGDLISNKPVEAQPVSKYISSGKIIWQEQPVTYFRDMIKEDLGTGKTWKEPVIKSRAGYSYERTFETTKPVMNIMEVQNFDPSAYYQKNWYNTKFKGSNIEKMGIVSDISMVPYKWINAAGTFYSSDKSISIAKGMGKKLTRETYVHELTHALDYKFRITENLGKAAYNPIRTPKYDKEGLMIWGKLRSKGYKKREIGAEQLAFGAEYWGAGKSELLKSKFPETYRRLESIFNPKRILGEKLGYTETRTYKKIIEVKPSQRISGFRDITSKILPFTERAKSSSFAEYGYGYISLWRNKPRVEKFGDSLPSSAIPSAKVPKGKVFSSDQDFLYMKLGTMKVKAKSDRTLIKMVNPEQYRKSWPVAIDPQLMPAQQRQQSTIIIKSFPNSTKQKTRSVEQSFNTAQFIPIASRYQLMQFSETYAGLGSTQPLKNSLDIRSIIRNESASRYRSINAQSMGNILGTGQNIVNIQMIAPAQTQKPSVMAKQRLSPIQDIGQLTTPKPYRGPNPRPRTPNPFIPKVEFNMGINPRDDSSRLRAKSFMVPSMRGFAYAASIFRAQQRQFGAMPKMISGVAPRFLVRRRIK